MDDEEFGRIIDKAVEELPWEFKEKLNNVSIVIADWPSEEQSKFLSESRRGELLLGLYQGVPQTKRSHYGVGLTLPDKITIFKIPLLSISKNYKHLVKNIENTVIHEIAHHFGMSENDIQKAKREQP